MAKINDKKGSNAHITRLRLNKRGLNNKNRSISRLSDVLLISNLKKPLFAVKTMQIKKKSRQRHSSQFTSKLRYTPPSADTFFSFKRTKITISRNDGKFPDAAVRLYEKQGRLTSPLFFALFRRMGTPSFSFLVIYLFIENG